MGAGNPLLRSFDTDRYQPTTYFIDFTNYDDEFIKQECEENDEDFESITDERRYEIINNQAEFDVQDFTDEWDWLEEFGVVACDHKSIDELSAAYRGSGIVIAETDTGYIVTTTDSEYHHFAFGMIPKTKFEDLEEEVSIEEESKFDWYCSRNLEQKYYDMCDKKAEAKYEKMLKQFRKENEPVMRKIHECFHKNMSARNGAWMSCPLKMIGKQFKFL